MFRSPEPSARADQTPGCSLHVDRTCRQARHLDTFRISKRRPSGGSHAIGDRQKFLLPCIPSVSTVHPGMSARIWYMNSRVSSLADHFCRINSPYQRIGGHLLKIPRDQGSAPKGERAAVSKDVLRTPCGYVREYSDRMYSLDCHSTTKNAFLEAASGAVVKGTYLNPAKVTIPDYRACEYNRRRHLNIHPVKPRRPPKSRPSSTSTPVTGGGHRDLRRSLSTTWRGPTCQR